MNAETHLILEAVTQAATRRITDFQPERIDLLSLTTKDLIERTMAGDLSSPVHLLTLGLEQELIRLRPQQETYRMNGFASEPTKHMNENRHSIRLDMTAPSELAYRLRRFYERDARVAIIEVPSR